MAKVFGEPILELLLGLPDTISKKTGGVSYRKFLFYLASKVVMLINR